MEYIKLMETLCVLSFVYIKMSVCEKFTKYYAVADVELQNSMSMLLLGSSVACGVACNGIADCVAYTYSLATKSCIISNDTSVSTVTSPGNTVYLKHCKVGWKKFGSSCYLFSTTPRSWESSKLYCESIGATLVKVESDEEHQFIRQTVASTGSSGYFWIGARYNFTAGEHRWLDGTKMTFSGWGSGRPGTQKGCVDYLNNLNWLWNSHWDCSGTPGAHICETCALFC